MSTMWRRCPILARGGRPESRPALFALTQNAFARHRPDHLLARMVLAGLAVAGALAGSSASAAAAAPPPASASPASLVNPIIGTSGGVNTFPGPTMPFGMLQWSPDTYPSRPFGGGYEYNTSQIRGFSLTHIATGCPAYNDVPILPLVGAVPQDPSAATATFSHSEETARVGYYQLTTRSPAGPDNPSPDATAVRSELTAAMRAGIARFTFPASTLSNLLLKVADDEQPRRSGTTADVVGNDEVTGSITAGAFCGMANQRDYTLHFDIRFDHPFSSHSTWSGGPAGGPGGVALTFDTTGDQTVTAKIGISFTSAANAADNLDAEIPGWDFDAVHAADVQAWNRMLRRIDVGGGTSDQRTQFYTALYHALLNPNVFSDDNGQYMGMDGNVHTADAGHAQYANFSGWDVYRSQVQLAALVAPDETSDAIRSMLDDYDQNGSLPKWSQANGESYVMAGDPADAIIADAYAFGARQFDTRKALAAMVAQATQRSNARPGGSALDRFGYLPYDLSDYGCCDFYGPVSTQLEYDTDDYAIAALARAVGDRTTYERFATRAQDWENTFNVATGSVQARLTSGQWAPGFTPGTRTGMVEGTAAQYTTMVPFNLSGLIGARGGDDAYEDFLDSLFSDLGNLRSRSRTNADLSNEPSLGIPWQYDYVGAPWKTQRVVREAETQLYANAPAGQFGNDDLGAMSSWYVWANLGLYPETPGTDTLVIGTPTFQHAVVHLANGKDLTIDAANAAPDAPYVQGLTLNGEAWPKTYLRGNQYANGGALSFDLASTPNKSWGSGRNARPPSDGTGEQAILASVARSNVVIEPGASATTTLKATNITHLSTTASWTASSDPALTVTPAKGSSRLGPYGSVSQQITIRAARNTAYGPHDVTFHVRTAAGSEQTVTLAVAVPKPGEIWPYFTSIGISNDDHRSAAAYDGGGWSYSEQALASAGVTPGGTVSADGIDYVWPDVSTPALDNIEAEGQTIPLNAPTGATRIGLLGSSTDAGSSGAGGTATVTYTDGSTSQFTARFSDWRLNWGGDAPLAGNFRAVTMPYQNYRSGYLRSVIPTYVFALDAPLTPGKTVRSITLPTSTGGEMHVFAIGFD